VAFLVGSFQEASYVSTLSNHALSEGCFTSSMVVWDPGIIFIFSLDQLMEHQVMMALLKYMQYLGREGSSCLYFWVPLFFSIWDFRVLPVEKNE